MRHADLSTFADAHPLPTRVSIASQATRIANWGLALLSLPARVVAHRRDMALLGAMSASELSDIGLTRQDVRDASMLPPGQAPGALLTRRAAERRHAALAQPRR